MQHCFDGTCGGNPKLMPCHILRMNKVMLCAGLFSKLLATIDMAGPTIAKPAQRRERREGLLGPIRWRFDERRRHQKNCLGDIHLTGKQHLQMGCMEHGNHATPQGRILIMIGKGSDAHATITKCCQDN